ncbi:MAG: hypothetical protein ACRD2A_08805 [Vicinamibacterales bacterium]
MSEGRAAGVLPSRWGALARLALSAIEGGAEATRAGSAIGVFNG